MEVLKSLQNSLVNGGINFSLVVLFFEPRVCHAFFNGQSLIFFFVKHFFDKVNTLHADSLPNFVFKFDVIMQNAIKDLFVVITVERRIPTQQNIHDNSELPHITLHSVIAFEHLRSQIVRCADHRVHMCFFLEIPLTQAKIN